MSYEVHPRRIGKTTAAVNENAWVTALDRAARAIEAPTEDELDETLREPFNLELSGSTRTFEEQLRLRERWEAVKNPGGVDFNPGHGCGCGICP